MWPWTARHVRSEVDKGWASTCTMWPQPYAYKADFVWHWRLDICIYILSLSTVHKKKVQHLWNLSTPFYAISSTNCDFLALLWLFQFHFPKFMRFQKKTSPNWDPRDRINRLSQGDTKANPCSMKNLDVNPETHSQWRPTSVLTPNQSHTLHPMNTNLHQVVILKKMWPSKDSKKKNVAPHCLKKWPTATAMKM